MQVVAYVQRRLNLRHTLGAVAEGLVAEAMQPQRCAHDNVTVVVVQVRWLELAWCCSLACNRSGHGCAYFSRLVAAVVHLVKNYPPSQFVCA